MYMFNNTTWFLVCHSLGTEWRPIIALCMFILAHTENTCKKNVLKFYISKCNIYFPPVLKIFFAPYTIYIVSILYLYISTTFKCAFAQSQFIFSIPTLLYYADPTT